MTLFPAVDPIPLPAPVWLFKLLHLVTFILHLTAVELLLGCLTAAIVFHLAGRYLGKPDATQISGLLAHRLPTLMAYVINLGVPPLLFAQVLYGRALYTSSVLIGAYWISVIFLLIASYFGLYFASKRASARKNWGGVATGSLILALAIAFIYSNNMSLMLRPETWQSMYHASPSGLQLNTGDPGLWPRWCFFVIGAFPASGCALLLLSLKPELSAPVKRLLCRTGGITAAAAIVAQCVAGMAVAKSTAAPVLSKTLEDAFYHPFVYSWFASALVLLLMAVAAGFIARPVVALCVAPCVVVFLNIAAAVVVRDGIRDYTLRAAGMEVWARRVVTNWSVVGIFLVLFVAALAAMGFMAYVVAKARRLEENYV
jgi:hypothetical protein